MKGAELLDVCLATLRFYPVYSGPGERFRRYAPGLRERGVDLRVFSAAWIEEEVDGEDRYGPGAVGRIVDPVEVDGVRVDRVLLSREMGRVGMLSAYFRALERHVRSGELGHPDVLQFLTLAPWGIPWLLRLKWQGVPMVYTQTMMRDPSIGALKNLLAGLPMRVMDRVVVSTGVMEDSVRSLGYRGPVDIIPNGLDLDRFRPAEDRAEVEETRRRLGLPPSGEIVTFVGGYLEPRKGIDVLAEAWGEIAPERPGSYLILVGPHQNDLRPSGPQRDYLDRVDRSLERSGARDRVVFTGRVDNVEEYLRVTDVFVFPSRREGMPNVVPEAFGCGVACVLTEFVGFPEEFGVPGRQFLLAERTPEHLAESVVELLEEEEHLRRIGGEARQWVEEHLSLHSSLDLYASLYRRLALSSAAVGGT